MVIFYIIYCQLLPLFDCIGETRHAEVTPAFNVISLCFFISVYGPQNVTSKKDIGFARGFTREKDRHELALGEELWVSLF